MLESRRTLLLTATRDATNHDRIRHTLLIIELTLDTIGAAFTTKDCFCYHVLLLLLSQTVAIFAAATELGSTNSLYEDL